MPFYCTNQACGVANAATRKYFTKDRLWYFPPPEAFKSLVSYANKHGKPEGMPYFSIDGKRSLTDGEWEQMRAKFNCLFGIQNVWNEPPMHGDERIKNGVKSLHANQKPLSLTKIIISASSDIGDVVWEPFGGMCTGALASKILKRRCFSAELIDKFYRLAVQRVANDD